MAVYVVLAFDDEDHARTLVEDMLSYPDKPLLTPAMEHDVRGGRVLGVFKKPTLFCDGHAGRKTQTGYTRGQKWGWWVCSACMKPKRMYAEAIADGCLGNNLLPKEVVGIPNRRPEQESPAQWKDLKIIEE